MSNSMLQDLSKNIALAAFLLLLPFSDHPSRAADENPVVLENEQLRLEVESDHGTITRIVDKQGQINLAPAGGLADNFRLTLREAGKRIADKNDKVIMGRNQKVTSVTKTDGGLNLVWNGPLTDSNGGSHPIDARMEIRLAGPELEFRFFLQNDTDLKVADAWYPIVGGLAKFGRDGKDDEASVMLPTASPTIKKIAFPFGELALHYPDGCTGQMVMSYASVFDAKSNRAMYISSQDTIARLKFYRFFEESLGEVKDVSACIAHKPFTPKGKSFEGSPVVLRFYDGDWNAAGRIYREWFVKTFGVAKLEGHWIRNESVFESIMFILPEGTLNMTFKEIPAWAKDAKDRGVNALLLCGWNRGGHDNGYPYYEPDPRLGTYEDLKQAIAECHKMGVKVNFFVNYQPVMIQTDWWKNELHKYAEVWEDGGHGLRGWAMGTLWGRMGHPKLEAWVDIAFPEYRDILINYFMKLVEIGADGLHVDKMVPGAYNFNPRCELGPDTSTWEGAIRLTRMFLDKAHKINPDFDMSFECDWDRMLEFSGSMWWRGNLGYARKIFPEISEMSSISSSYDFLGVNDAVRLSDVFHLAPLNYSRSISWGPFRKIAEYIQEVKRIRDGLNDPVFFGEVLGHEQIQLGHEPPYGVEYADYRSQKTDRRVCIFTNKGREDQIQTISGFDGNMNGRVKIHVPYVVPREVALPAKVTIPGEGIVFVEELPKSDEKDVLPTPAKDEAASKTPSPNTVVNGGFESGDFTGWTADPNWIVDNNSKGYYSGWLGKSFAWSGGKGEAATGSLKSKPFILDNDGVQLMTAGWNAQPGSSRQWNYVALKTTDGKEIDRRTIASSLVFVPLILNGAGHKGESVYLEAVDDSDGATYAMFCIDDVRIIALPSEHTQPLDPLPAYNEKESIKLENDRYCILANRSNGTISRIYDKAGKLELIREPRMADNYKFTLPLPGNEEWETLEANYIFGKDQKLDSFDLSDGKLALTWKTPHNKEGRNFDVTVVMGIELVDEGVRFTLKVENRTKYKIGEVFYPILGGVTGLGDTFKELKSTRLVRPAGSGFASSDLFFLFANFSWLGDQGAEQFYYSPKGSDDRWMAFVAGSSRNRSLFLGANDPAARSLTLHLELLPGEAKTPRWDGNWPRREELGGLPAGVLVSFVEFAECPPGKTYEAAPIILQAHDGDAQEAGKIFRKWNK